jgi:hypothetical protein
MILGRLIMISEPIESAMQELNALAPLLSAEVRQAGHTSAMSLQAIACKEALMTTGILMEKLKVIRQFLYEPGTGRCATCDDE